ncbi:MAG: hypothetical protein ACI92S_004524 [Planctomycetaceae bacterium]|jgi:hypothetical protein
MTAHSFLIRSLAIFASLVVAFGAPASAQDAPVENDYYRMDSFKLPEGLVLEIGGIEWFNEKLAISTRRGDIYTVENALAEKIGDAKLKPFAIGLHEVLGLTQKDGWLYATQRGEVSRLKDEDGDGTADIIETVCDKWGITGDYHEYAFGSKFDKDGNIWVVLCLTGSFNSNTPYRGWCVRVTPDGEMIPTCSGIRSPGGIGANHLGEIFYTDNQGPWNGTCSLKHLRPGSFQGHPGGNRWYETTSVIGPKPVEPKSGSRMMVEQPKIPELVPPAIYFPYKKMGQSASGVACDVSGGKFGPFTDQLFVGDQTFSTVMRCNLEMVNGFYQGACFPFREGFGSGSLAVQFTSDGSMFVGGTNRGWGSRGRQPYALDRLRWTGKVPFEIHEMKAKPDGFELTFTQPVDRETAANIESYKLGTYAYIFQAAYGSPEVDHTTPTIDRVEVSDDGQAARLFVTGLQRGHVHELHCDGVKSKAGLPLLHSEAYYTLNFIPKANAE